jgi:hypothetical protein
MLGVRFGVETSHRAPAAALLSVYLSAWKRMGPRIVVAHSTPRARRQEREAKTRRTAPGAQEEEVATTGQEPGAEALDSRERSRARDNKTREAIILSQHAASQSDQQVSPYPPNSAAAERFFFIEVLQPASQTSKPSTSPNSASAERIS